MKCPCSSNLSFSNCCEKILKGKAKAETAESLMRSRYTAYTLADISYIEKTTAPESRSDFDHDSTRKWAEESKWLGLKILSTEEGQSTDKKGIVEFVASFEQNGSPEEHHERSRFRKDDNGQWLFIDGESLSPQATLVRTEAKIGRNDPCPCGSQKKYKKCCAD